MCPIAVGNTLQKLIVKCASLLVRNEMAEVLVSAQLRYGIKRHAETAVHGAHIFLKNLQCNEVLLKLDFNNAFNTLQRDKMLNAEKQLPPVLLPHVYSAYSTYNTFWS